MFKSSQPTPYDDLVTKATDENLTGEDWETILNLCDKVQDEGEAGARKTIAALLKRLAHRSPNVQLYALSLAEALSKNCGIVLHRELASRVFTQGLERLVTDRTTHDKVRKRALGLVAMWAADFENDPSLGVMEECYSNLRSKNYKFETPNEPPPPAVDDEVRRREEEELQRVLEMSIHDRGGRNGQASTQSSSNAGGSGSGARVGADTAGSSTTTGPTYPSGYVPARSPPAATSSTSSLPAQSSPAPAAAPVSAPVVTRVRALHTFEATEPGELAFERGDIIRVVDRAYKDWWRGQLRGRTGIFPVNYVEPLPEPTAVELAREVEQEAAIFAQAADVDQLLTLLRDLDASGERLADNDEIQELYRSCMALRPKIVKLIDKYSQKRADLVSMNEGFIKARTLFDRMMEESLARHTGYDPRGDYPPYGRPDSRRQEYGAQPYGPGYPGYDQPHVQGHGYAAGYPEAPYPAQHAQYPPEQQTYGGHPSSTQSPYPPAQSPYPQVQAQAPFPQLQTSFPPGQTLYTQAQAAPAQQFPVQDTVQPQPQPQMQPQPQTQVQPQEQPQPQSQPQGQLQSATQVSPQPQQGPPYLYDPNTTYADPNVQAWAQYYAQGGKDLAGAVYFISVPGVTDAAEGGGPPPAGGPGQAGAGQEQGQQQSSVVAASPTPSSQQPGPYAIVDTGPTVTSSSPHTINQVQQPYSYVSSQPQLQSPQQYASTGGYTSSPSSAIGHGPPAGAGYNGGYDYNTIGALQQQFSDMGVSAVAPQAHAAPS